MRTKSLQSCTTLCYAMDHSPPVCSVYGFSRQDCWSGLLFPSPRNFPNPGIETASLISPELAGRFFTTGKPSYVGYVQWDSNMIENFNRKLKKKIS